MFVSSTFIDMRVERDELAKYIFPQLRRLCQERRVVWGEVDLRWGITDEQTAEDKVLPICLQEIHRCRPYFICLLGERYGSVPDHISPELCQQAPWLLEHRDRSVTEIEILHGVLNSPDLSGHAFFYFRDPAYIDRLPKDADRVEFVSESRDARKKLISLKDRIRSSGFPVRENYRDPETLGKLVLNDLQGVIDHLFPKEEILDPLTLEAIEHIAFARSRTGVYLGRQEYFDTLDNHIDSDDPPLIILGESGSGKSALISNWVIRFTHANPDEHVLIHFVGSTPQSTNWNEMLRRFMGEFKHRFGIEEEIPHKEDELRLAFANWLNMISIRGRALIIIDGLNQLEDIDGAPDLVWLPPVIPPNVRMILSTLPGRSLNALLEYDWPTLTIDRLTINERSNLIKEYLQQYTKDLNPEVTNYIAGSPQSANPLFLLSVLEELRVFGEREKLDERIHFYLEARDVPELYNRILLRWEQDYECGHTYLVRDTMALFWASRRGLSEAEVLMMLGPDNDPLPRAIWSPLRLAADAVFVNRSGLLTFAHQYIRKAVEDRYLSDINTRRSAHSQIAHHFFSSSDQLRVIDELPWQLTEANDWLNLAAILSNHEIFQTLFRRNRSELRRYWSVLERNSIFRIPNVYKDIINDPNKQLNIAFDVYDLLDETGHLDEAEELIGRIQISDTIKNNVNSYTACLSRLGLLDIKRSRFGQAMERFRECDRLAEKTGNKEVKITSLLNIAFVFKKQGERSNALKLIEDCLKLIEKSDNRRILSHALLQKAEIIADFGHIDDANTLFRDVCRLSQADEDEDIQKEALLSRTGMLYDIGELEKSERLIRENEAICHKTGDLSGRANSLNLLGLICKAQGDLEEALRLHREAATIYRNLGSKIYFAHALDNQAESLIRMRRFREARSLNETSVQIYREFGVRTHLAISLINQAILLLVDEKDEESLMIAQEAERIARELEDFASVGRSLCIVAEINQKQGNYESADAKLLEAIQTFSRVTNREGLMAAHGSRGRLLAISMEKPIEALSEFDKAIELGTQFGFRQVVKEILLFIVSHYENIGKLEIAFTAVEELIRQTIEDGDNNLLASVGLWASKLLSRLDRLDESESYAEDALRAAKKMANLEVLAQSHLQVGIVMRKKGNLKGSLDHVEQARLIFYELHDWSSVAYCIRLQVQIFLFDVHNQKVGIISLSEALSFATDHGLDSEVKKLQMIKKLVESD